MTSSDAEKQRIAVCVIATERTSQSIIEPILWGLEEEGIPAELRRSDVAPAPHLAKQAADASPLSVGIGINATDRMVTLQHRDLPAERPLFSLVGDELNPVMLRTLGVNAARLFKGDPFIVNDAPLPTREVQSADNLPSNGWDEIVASVVKEVLRSQDKR